MAILNGKLGQEYQARFGEEPGSPERWEQLCRDLVEERDQLRVELAEANVERDQLRKSLSYLLRPTPEECNFTKEELFAQIGNGPSFEEFMAELDAEVRASR